MNYDRKILIIKEHNSVGYKFFCLVVFVVQTVITYIDFKLARRHHNLYQEDAATVDILAGVSWGMTAIWWLYQAFTASIE